MDERLLTRYQTLFRKLRRDRKNGGAPHKPVLLLAVSELIRKGEITSPHIYITAELVLEFKNCWSRLVTTPHQPNFALPFFHMRSEPFWELVAFPGMQIGVTSSASVKSFKNLRETVHYAALDPVLFELLRHPAGNALLQHELLNYYFPDTAERWQQTQDYSVSGELELQIVSDTPLVYKQRMEDLKGSLSNEAYQEELFVRGAVFKRKVPLIYGYRCAISGLQVETTMNVQMVDACHIVPFAESGDDTIKNGFCLTPTLHRAFDRGIIVVDDSYRVRISPQMKENDSPYAIRQFEGKQLLLPESQYLPALENFRAHREKWL